MTLRRFIGMELAWVLVLAFLAGIPTGQTRRPLAAADIDDIATLLRLEDTRTFDEAALERILRSSHPEVRRRAAISIGRINREPGRPLLVAARTETNPTVLAAIVFATGQLKDPTAIEWLDELLRTPRTPVAIAREAAQALGKFRGVQDHAARARAVLATYLANAPMTAATSTVVGEALLSWGRFTGKDDVAPIARWASSPIVDVRWRVAWALFRPRDAAAIPHIMKLVDDASPEVRYWAVRGLAPTVVEQAGIARDVASAKLEARVKDPDRRVRTEALRALLSYDDDRAFAALLSALDSPDTWISTSAAEVVARFQTRADALKPRLIGAGAPNRPVWLRNMVLAPLTTMAPEVALETATSLARSGVGLARTSAVQALGRLGDAGRARYDELNAEPALKGLLPAFPSPDSGGGGGGGGGRGQQPAPAARTDADYRTLVEKWIVPEYNGKPRQRVIWQFAKGTIEIEVFGADAPMGAEYLMQSIQSGDLIGTEFSRVVPNFVLQQQGVRNAPRLRDEVNQHGLTRANLSWASSGLDTGRPAYTIGHTPQPHNEGDFTALGRVVVGMDVVDRLEWGDKVVSAKIK